MTLISILGTGSIDIGGENVPYHALSRAEVFKFQSFGEDTEGAEVFALVHGTAFSAAEINKWRETSDLETVGKLVDAIVVISGLATQKMVDRANAKRHGVEVEDEAKPENPR
jgi:hypothetical protein